MPNAAENPAAALRHELIDAACHNDVAAMKRLLAAGADFNAVDEEEGTTAFSEALYYGVSKDSLHTMLGFGANPDVASTVGGTPLVFAVWGLDYRMLQTLLDAGANPNTIAYNEESRETALDYVYDEFHCVETEGEKMVLKAMEFLLKSRGGKCAHELGAARPHIHSGNDAPKIRPHPRAQA